VLTGEAAVTVGAHDQGLVAGDLVNAASRIQSVAEPGSVLVGESTKRMSEAAVAYDAAGEHLLKGRSEPMQLWRALRVVGGVRGASRSTGLEAPFVGRDRELRLVKELFHSSADERRAQLALVNGIAGIGKSRLAWEFEKYIDGLVDDTLWHRGRCLSYGEGVAYWALADMVRMRCNIVEDEDAESARAKLRATLSEYLDDADERSWVEPRLAHLLGLEDRGQGDQENLFPAWRILFERMSQQAPTMLVFEDLQWADEGLLDFIDYLLDWSRGQPLFVLALARPELATSRPNWGAGRRGFSSLYLEPLPASAMDQLLTGLVPGLPEDVRTRILDRAEGVPLYAVETVRMLLDRGRLAPEGNVYRAIGEIGDLEVPETLHALVAARLDALTPPERRLIESGAVLGKTFTKQALTAVSGVEGPTLDELLTGLLAKEMLSVQADPRSPERGQYSFLQDIVKRVAYDTISRHDRKTKHVAAAEFLASAPMADEGEIAEVVASHYLDAYDSAPDDADAGELRARGFQTLVRAANRAAALGANLQAQRAFERAAALTDEVEEKAELHERAGIAANVGGHQADASANFEMSIDLFRSAGASHPAARVAARAAEISWEQGRLEQGLQSMDEAFAVLATEEPDADLAALAAQIGRFMYFAGRGDVALERLDRALDIAEALSLPETLSHALNTRALVLYSNGRRTESLALLRVALDLALDHDKPSVALRAYYNLADHMVMQDRVHEAAGLLRDGLALARRAGNRYWEQAFLGNAYSLYVLGEWDEVVLREQQLPPTEWTQVRLAFGTLLTAIVPVLLHRGQVGEAQRFTRLSSELEGSADVQELAQVLCAQAALLHHEGRDDEALRLALEAFGTGRSVGLTYEAVREAWVVGIDSALALGDLQQVEKLLAAIDDLPPGRSSNFLRAQSSRFHARLAATAGDSAAGPLFVAAADGFREIAFAFYVAVTLLEQGEWLVNSGNGDVAGPLVDEALDIFERLEAKPWLERASKLATPRV
jgi:tetratricopeptide (TPR) repeat protein